MAFLQARGWVDVTSTMQSQCSPQRPLDGGAPVVSQHFADLTIDCVPAK